MFKSERLHGLKNCFSRTSNVKSIKPSRKRTRLSVAVFDQVNEPICCQLCSPTPANGNDPCLCRWPAWRANWGLLFGRPFGRPFGSSTNPESPTDDYDLGSSNGSRNSWGAGGALLSCLGTIVWRIAWVRGSFAGQVARKCCVNVQRPCPRKTAGRTTPMVGWSMHM